MQHKITSLSPYTTQIGLIVSEINIIRNETLELTKNLSISELDFNFDSQSNSIGTLLLHIATVELKFQLDHFLMRSITMAEFRKFGNAVWPTSVYGYDMKNPKRPAMIHDEFGRSIPFRISPKNVSEPFLWVFKSLGLIPIN